MPNPPVPSPARLDPTEANSQSVHALGVPVNKLAGR